MVHEVKEECFCQYNIYKGSYRVNRTLALASGGPCL
jgi:hypothetical protein